MNNILFFVFLLSLSGPGVSAQATALEIWEIQGTTATSPYLGEEVITTGVVTAVGTGFFFLQSPENRADQDSGTSNGIYVVSNQAGNYEVGDLLELSGSVAEVEDRTQIGPANLLITFLGSDTPLPSPVILDRDFPSGQGSPLPELEAVEGMLVAFSGITSGPSDYRSMVPVVAGNQRPFREPGIRYPGLTSLPVWDGNPEIFWLAPNGLDQANNRFIVATTAISASGPMYQSEAEYILFPQQYELGESPAVRFVRAAASDEISVGSLNTRRLEENSEDFSRSARKLARYVVEMLHAPDILALQEVGSLAALSTLRFFIQQLRPELEYTPFFLAGNSDIHLAYLVKADKFESLRIEQLAKAETLGGGIALFDRPPLLLVAQLPDQPEISLQVLNIHLRSLLGIEGDNEGFVREKRYRQSISVANMVQELRNDNLLLVGDFNAYPFSDGYVDVVNQITGEESAGAQLPPEPIVIPPLQNLTTSLPAEESYSFIFDGSAQLIDHALINQLEGLYFNGLAFARANADYPDTFAPNELLVERSSDHDGFVVYLQTRPPSALNSAPADFQPKIYPNPVRAKQPFQLELPGDVRAHIRLVAANGRFVGQMLKQKGTNIVNMTIEKAGYYTLYIRNEKWFHSEKLVVLPAD